MWTELRFAIRECRLSPALSAALIATLALSLSAVGITWGAFDAIVLRAVPGEHPDRVAMVAFASATSPTLRTRLSWSDIASLKAVSHTLQHVAGYGRGQAATVTGERTIQAVAVPATTGFFESFGVSPQRGRWFADTDNCAIVISDGVWQAAFGRTAEGVGRPLDVDGEPCLVVGVAPPAFNIPDRAGTIWRYRALQPTAQLPGARDQFAIGLPRAGTSLTQVEAELNGLIRAGSIFDVADGVVFSVSPLRDQIVGSARTVLTIVAGAVTVLLLTACVNIMSLLLARQGGRQRDAAIRRALGATRLDIFRQTALHVIVLASIGSATGLALAVWVTRSLRTLAPRSIAGMEHLHVDIVVVGLVLFTALVAALAVSVLPAARAWSASDGVMLREGALVTSGGSGFLRRRRGQAVLVTAQIALVVSLATGAGLLTRSLVKLLSIDVGFAPAGLASYLFSLPGEPGEALGLSDLLAAVRTLPGVRAAALGTLPPFIGLTVGTRFDVETRDGWNPASVATQSVSADYFRVMEIPVREGRIMSETLRSNDPCEVVINEALARSAWPRESPLQHRLDLAEAGGAPLPPPDNPRPTEGSSIVAWPENKRFCTVVGIVGNVREKSLIEPAQERLYFSVYQWPSGSATLLVRTSGDPLDQAGAIRTLIRSSASSLARTYGLSAQAPSRTKCNGRLHTLGSWPGCSARWPVWP
jgi:putative ABC transport system permease protein